MDNPLVIGVIGWLFPGGGHLLQRRYKRGAIIAAAILGMLVAGLVSGGGYYPGFGFSEGTLLYLLNVFAKLGSGTVSIASFLSSVEPAPNVAARATFEYGGRFVETAGLLNIIAIIDAIDIAVGRKK